MNYQKNLMLLDIYREIERKINQLHHILLYIKKAIANFKTEEEALEFQKEFSKDYK